MIRHSQNSNLVLHYEPYYQGLPVQTRKGPLVEEYLGVLKHVIETALSEYRRVFAFRLDLRFPVGQHSPYADDNLVLERFCPDSAAQDQREGSFELEVLHAPVPSAIEKETRTEDQF